jgi:alpha,alpha-trehalase
MCRLWGKSEKKFVIQGGIMDRRSFGAMAIAGAIAMVTGRSQSMAAELQNFSSNSNGAGAGADDDLKARWVKLDNAVRSWWDGDLRHADEDAIRNDPKKTLLFLPFPYGSGGGSESAFPEIYGWDTQFTNLALIAHGRTDIVRWHILDQISQIQRYGMVLNGNRSYYISRSQPPLLAWSVENYLTEKPEDEELALIAYPNLVREYSGYWNAPGHATPIGLSTCRDSGSETLRPELAAECESGLDFTPIFDGDIRRCVPIHVNVSLVRYAQVLSWLATRFGWHEKATLWKKEADQRAERIQQYCWDDKEGCYFEYDYVRKKRLPYYSLNVFWPLWAGIASKEQARQVVEHLKLFDRPYGLTFTDKHYPSPHHEYEFNEWAYPEAWPPQQILVALALQRYGYHGEASAVSRRYIQNMLDTWDKTGHLWERYNAVEGGHDVPIEREPPRPLHGFTSASAVIAGRAAFESGNIERGPNATPKG